MTGLRFKRRRGFTLMEMAAVLAIGSATLSLAVWTIAGVVVQGTRAGERFHRETELDRCGGQFRRDVSMASNAEIIDSGCGLRLSGERVGGRIIVEYRIVADGGIERRLAGGLASRTIFAVHADAAESRFTIGSDAGAAVVVGVRIAASTRPEKRGPRIDRTLEAVVGSRPGSVEIAVRKGTNP